jgi:MerR family transcriptional regulator, copper efflux regulator
MRIREFSQSAGISPHTIRFYEKKGILTPRRSTQNGYREYTADDLEIIRSVAIGRALGFSLREIKKGADAWRGGALTAHKQIQMLTGKVAEIDAKLHQWRLINSYLKRKIAWLRKGGTALAPKWPQTLNPQKGA